MLADPRHGVRHATALRRVARGHRTCAPSCTARPTCSSAARSTTARSRGCSSTRSRSAPSTSSTTRSTSPAAGAESAEEERALRRLALTAEALRRARLPREPVPRLPGALERLPRPAVGARPVKRLDSPAVRDAARRRARARGRRLHGRRDRDAGRARARRRAALPRARQPRRAARGARAARRVDPLQLDLHLPPGGGTVPWDDALEPSSLRHEAPLMMEIHPAHRPVPSSLWEAAVTALAPSRAHPAPRALTSPASPGDAGSASVPGARGLPARATPLTLSRRRLYVGSPPHERAPGAAARRRPGADRVPPDLLLGAPDPGALAPGLPLPREAPGLQQDIRRRPARGHAGGGARLLPHASWRAYARGFVRSSTTGASRPRTSAWPG